MPLVTASQWSEFLDRHAGAHLLQTAEWGQLKTEFGWCAEHVVVDDSGALLLFRDLPLGLSLAYIPKGPVGEDWEALWPEIDARCRARRAAFLKVEPDLWEHQGIAPGLQDDFRPSPHWLQPPRTLVVDLGDDEETILGRMKQKTRYNIRLAERKAVVVRSSDDVRGFHGMMQVTGERDRFGVHSLTYYQRAYELFHPYGACELLVAEYDGQPLAGLMAFARGERAWYFYGASTDQERNRMPTYLLQWEAMRWARDKGCRYYDLWGVPDADLEALESQFTERADGLWGVYRFKRGFGGKLVRAVGSWDRVYNPALYALYRLYVRFRGSGE